MRKMNRDIALLAVASIIVTTLCIATICYHDDSYTVYDSPICYVLISGNTSDITMDDSYSFELLIIGYLGNYSRMDVTYEIECDSDFLSIDTDRNSTSGSITLTSDNDSRVIIVSMERSDTTSIYCSYDTEITVTVTAIQIYDEDYDSDSLFVKSYEEVEFENGVSTSDSESISVHLNAVGSQVENARYQLSYVFIFVITIFASIIHFIYWFSENKMIKDWIFKWALLYGTILLMFFIVYLINPNLDSLNESRIATIVTTAMGIIIPILFSLIFENNKKQPKDIDPKI